MERLSGMDALFLYLESPTQHMHVTLCAVLDPADMPGGYSFERIRDHLAARVHLIPAFTRVLVPVPLNLHHPLWVEDSDFQIDRHVHRVALPRSGTADHLASFTAQVAGIPLERTRPLWDMWVVEGVEGDRFALIAKLHHSLLDGVAGVEQLAKLFDIDRAGDAVEPPSPERPAEAVPSDLELVTYAAVSRAIGALEILPLVGRTASSLLEVRRTRSDRRGGTTRRRHDLDDDPLASDDDEDVDVADADATEEDGIAEAPAGGTPLVAPRTPFNGTITARRAVGFTRISLDEVKQAKVAMPGATVNDVILTVCAGAIRRYLADCGELPDEPLVAACPVNVRTADQAGRSDNRVSALFAMLHTEVEDPRERLAATMRTAAAAKREHALFGPETLQQWAEIVDPNLASWLSGRYAGSGVARRHRPAINVMISNVPGPPFPLYLAGAELIRAYPMGQIIEGVGLNITVMSYRGSVDFGFMAAANLVPDVDRLAAAVEPAFAALLAALDPR